MTRTLTRTQRTLIQTYMRDTHTYRLSHRSPHSSDTSVPEHMTLCIWGSKPGVYDHCLKNDSTCCRAPSHKFKRVLTRAYHEPSAPKCLWYFRRGYNGRTSEGKHAKSQAEVALRRVVRVDMRYESHVGLRVCSRIGSFPKFMWCSPRSRLPVVDTEMGKARAH